ncbi:TrkA C-terminal domain-containing protein [Bacteroides nordii]|uniref:TrkA C-terminal domain-containing protein n=1 Tax=Bacteroides nordii TaxID=291645 RepID=UPI003520398E
MINKQLGDLNLQRNFGCTVTRVRRSGIDLSPSPDLALKFGDKLMVVGEKEGIQGVARCWAMMPKNCRIRTFSLLQWGLYLAYYLESLIYPSLVDCLSLRD